MPSLTYGLTVEVRQIASYCRSLRVQGRAAKQESGV